MNLKDLSLLSFPMFWLVVFSIFKMWGRDHKLSISEHLALNKSSYLLSLVALSGVNILFGLFMYRWIFPIRSDFATKSVFEALLALQVLLVVIPDTKGLYSKLHRLTAYAWAVSLLLIGVYVVLNFQFTNIGYIILYGLLLYMATSFTVIVLMRKGRQSFLIYQALYIAAFQAILLLAALR